MSRLPLAPRGRCLALAVIGLIAACSDVQEGLPVEPSPIPPLASVSRTHLSPEAAAAIDACAITWDHVAGIGLVPSARDVALDAPLSGREPELQTDRPAWVIQATGRIAFILAPGEALDPTCVVIEGEPMVFDTGGSFTDRGVFEPPHERHVPPARLPPLGP